MRLSQLFSRSGAASVLTGTSVVVLAFTAVMFMTAAVPVWDTLNQQIARAAEPGNEGNEAVEDGFFRGVANVDESGALTQKVNLNDSFFIDVPSVGGFFGSSYAPSASNAGGGGSENSGSESANVTESSADPAASPNESQMQQDQADAARENERMDYWNRLSECFVAASDALAYLENAVACLPIEDPSGYPIQKNGGITGVRERCYYVLSQASIYRGAAYQARGGYPLYDENAREIQRSWDLACAGAQLVLNTLTMWEAMPASHYVNDVGDPTPYMGNIRSHMVTVHNIGDTYRTLSEAAQARQILNNLSW